MASSSATSKTGRPLSVESILKNKPSYSFYSSDDAIVIDLGSLYSKVGFSSDHSPRFIIPYRPPKPHPSPNDLLQLCSLEFTQSDTEYVISILRDHLFDVFFRYLLCDPKNKSVVLCENPLMPVRLKEVIAHVLFDYFQIESLSFVPSPLASLMTLGQEDGIVFDCGHLETFAIPIYDGRPLITSIHSIPIAGNSVTQRLKELLVRFGSLLTPLNDGTSSSQTSIKSSSQGVWLEWAVWALGGPLEKQQIEENEHTTGYTLVPWDNSVIESILTLEFLEEIKSRVCFVGDIPKEEEFVVGQQPVETTKADHDPKLVQQYKIYKSTATTVYYPLGDRGTKVTGSKNMKLIIPGWVRERAAEVLFEGDDDSKSIATCILDALKSSPSDTRSTLSKTILLTGGTSMLPGFYRRVYAELDAMIGSNKFYEELKGLLKLLLLRKPGDGVIHCNISSWVGASIASSAKLLSPKFEFTKSQYASALSQSNSPPSSEPLPQTSPMDLKISSLESHSVNAIPDWSNQLYAALDHEAPKEKETKSVLGRNWGIGNTSISAKRYSRLSSGEYSRTGIVGRSSPN
ncbi:actin-domain-containing protein [Paraphysoderma sedebokerense]|nr:actin-domain-containing protein [Paraphysoderma sedebokerense]